MSNSPPRLFNIHNSDSMKTKCLWFVNNQMTTYHSEQFFLFSISELNYDEATLEQQRQIEKDVCTEVHLVL